MEGKYLFKVAKLVGGRGFDPKAVSLQSLLPALLHVPLTAEQTFSLSCLSL